MDLLLNYMENDSALFSAISNNKILPSKIGIHYKLIWGTLWQYFNHIKDLKNNYTDFYDFQNDNIDNEKFIEYYFILVTEFSYGLKFLEIYEKYKGFDVILNESSKEIGYPKNSYDIIKKRILKFRNPIIFSMHYRTYRDLKNKPSLLDTIIQKDQKYLISMYKNQGSIMTLKYTVEMLDEGRFALWYPIQKHVAKLMGNIKVWRRNEVFITDDQIDELHEILQPGDILLQRREWVLTNLGIPGYWTHSALYIGTPADRQHFFGNDSSIYQWLNKQNNMQDYNKLLKQTYPEAYNQSLSPINKIVPTIIESIEEGVVFNTLRESALCDGIAILRPKLTKMEIAMAIYNAFGYSGRPYDFDFNFLTDSSLICTELIYKSYEPNENSRGLTFDLKNVRKRKLIVANDIAAEFDKKYDTPENQLDFIAFYDVNEKKHKAILSNIEEFRKSWKRSKFHFLLSE